MEEVCAEVLRSHGIEAEPRLLEEALLVSERYYEERYRTDDTFWASEVEARRMWVSLYSILAEELGAEDAGLLGEALYEEFGKGSRWALYEDAVPAMCALRDMGVLMGIISNWDARLSSLCLDLDLSPFIRFVVSSACVGRIKPEPSIFRLALKRAGVDASRALHVGDHYYADVLGARGAGIVPVWLNRRGDRPPCDCLVIESLFELPELVKSL